VKKKQKQITMAVLGVAAVGLCALKLGPIIMGKSLVEQPPPSKKSKANKARPPARKKRSRRPPKRRSAPRRRAAPRRGAPVRAHPRGPEGPAPLFDYPLEEVPIELSRTDRRVLLYKPDGLRNPFGPAEFEIVSQSSMLDKVKWKLEGVVCSSGRRLAILNGRVYAAGKRVAEGVILKSVGTNSVVLTDGKRERQLFLSVPELNLGKP
jgi:hypothetical protein